MDAYSWKKEKYDWGLDFRESDRFKLSGDQIFDGGAVIGGFLQLLRQWRGFPRESVNQLKGSINSFSSELSRID